MNYKHKTAKSNGASSRDKNKSNLKHITIIHLYAQFLRKELLPIRCYKFVCTGKYGYIYMKHMKKGNMKIYYYT